MFSLLEKKYIATEIEKQKQGCLHPLLEALAALDKLEVENDKQ